MVLLRDTPQGVETFLVRRHGSTAFGDMWAFPGGVVDGDDARVVDACDGMSGTEANQLLDVRNGLTYFSAAIREVFEETSVLLATSSAEPASLRRHRDGLNDGSLRWPEFVVSTNARLDCSALHYLSYWITPEGMPKRFATRFFAARLPHGQLAEHCGGELIESAWQSPAAALEAHEAGRLPMIFPTLRTLEQLRDADSVDEALDLADRLAARGIDEILPRAVMVDGERRVLMPGEPGYADS